MLADSLRSAKANPRPALTPNHRQPPSYKTTPPIIRILSELSTFVDVPVEHQVSDIAPPIGEGPTDGPQPFRILSGGTRPCDPFVAVCYEGRWFWIDKGDYRSKRTLGYLLVLLALADTGAKENLPVITIQAN